MSIAYAGVYLATAEGRAARNEFASEAADGVDEDSLVVVLAARGRLAAEGNRKPTREEFLAAAEAELAA